MMLKDKVAIITGSSGGLGKGIALSFASQGARVVITSRDIKRAQRTAYEINRLGGEAYPCCFDLEDPSDSETLLGKVLEEFRHLDILVNNALNRPGTPLMLLQNMDYSQLQSLITSNLTNVLALTGQAYPYLKKTSGNVLNIGSVIVNRNMLGIPLYAILKGALTQATKALAAEWAADGIRVNQINPGFVRTDTFVKKMPAEHLGPIIEHYRRQHPLGRVGESQEIGDLAAYMVSSHSAWMTGSVVDMDGGFSVQGVAFPGGK